MADVLIDAKVQKKGMLYKLPFANQLVRPRGSWKKRYFVVKVGPPFASIYAMVFPGTVRRARVPVLDVSDVRRAR